jgi:hypothetical protein
MDNVENVEKIQKVIDSMISQIDLISNRCQIMSNINNANKRVYKKDDLLESSSIVLQMSRTLSELIIIQQGLKNNESDLSGLINGRLKL